MCIHAQKHPLAPASVYVYALVEFLRAPTLLLRAVQRQPSTMGTGEEIKERNLIKRYMREFWQRNKYKKSDKEINGRFLAKK